MDAWRYEISLLMLKKYFSHSRYFSILEEKFHISTLPCDILYKKYNYYHYCFLLLLLSSSLLLLS